MTLKDKIDVIEQASKITVNPRSIDLLAQVMVLLKQAESFWLIPGKQAEAIRLEEQADDLLRKQRG